jgi:hypothetical protein
MLPLGRAIEKALQYTFCGWLVWAFSSEVACTLEQVDDIEALLQ